MNIYFPTPNAIFRITSRNINRDDMTNGFRTVFIHGHVFEKASENLQRRVTTYCEEHELTWFDDKILMFRPLISYPPGQQSPIIQNSWTLSHYLYTVIKIKSSMRELASDYHHVIVTGDCSNPRDYDLIEGVTQVRDKFLKLIELLRQDEIESEAGTNVLFAYKSNDPAVSPSYLRKQAGLAEGNTPTTIGKYNLDIIQVESLSELLRKLFGNDINPRPQQELKSKLSTIELLDLFYKRMEEAYKKFIFPDKNNIPSGYISLKSPQKGFFTVRIHANSSVNAMSLFYAFPKTRDQSGVIFQAPQKYRFHLEGILDNELIDQWIDFMKKDLGHMKDDTEVVPIEKVEVHEERLFSLIDKMKGEKKL